MHRGTRQQPEKNENWASWQNRKLSQRSKDNSGTRKSKVKNRTRYTFRDFDAHMSAENVPNVSFNDCGRGGELFISVTSDNKIVSDILQKKHPQLNVATTPTLLQLRKRFALVSCSFQQNTSRSRSNAGMKRHGSHRPSGVDASEWWCWMTNFN